MFALLAFAIVAGPQLLESREELRNAPQFRLTAASIALTDVPDWIPVQTRNRVVDRLVGETKRSMLDEGLLESMAEEVAGESWVESVVRIEKRVPKGLNVHLTWRRPVAVVQTRQSRIAVDVNGYMLPVADLPESLSTNLPRIDAAQFPNPPAEARRWPDSRILAAARIVHEIGDRWSEFELDSVVPLPIPVNAKSVSDLQFALKTKSGSEVLWGRAPGIDWPGELTPEQKIAHLEHYRRSFGPFSEGMVYQIDIRHWNEISRLPLDRVRN